MYILRVSVNIAVHLNHYRYPPVRVRLHCWVNKSSQTLTLAVDSLTITVFANWTADDEFVLCRNFRHNADVLQPLLYLSAGI